MQGRIETRRKAFGNDGDREGMKPTRLRVKHTEKQCVQCSNQRSDVDQNVRERVGTCNDVFGSD